ncbi:LexA family transcriptional regulator [Bizionia argentinensis JUB59]|uniref:LexA family transcriptional regulator n=1 Tax=Bizionia argentinensis JUB59 TaxID=1046627 RepID=G2EB63_9FLAO|nr:LexA family transcriptional regulator [Bizionia argentinensis]EGV44238.1 LexA family transcriptional regulator [Bizionia argentinensis JUB59]
MDNKFTYIKERILHLVEIKGFGKEDFFDKLGMSYGSFKGSAKERPINSNAIENILTIIPDANLNWIITGKGEPIIVDSIKNYQNNKQSPYSLNEPNLPKLITVDSQGNENTVLVPVHAQAGYISGFGDPDYISTLPTYRLPRLNNGTFRMFEVKGHSMVPTLHSGCIVVGEYCENWYDLKDGQIYIIITEDGIVVKRVINRLEKYGNLFLKSDNRSEFPSYILKPEEIKEVWKVSLAMLFNLLDPSTLFDRINDLEADVTMLKQKKPKK